MFQTWINPTAITFLSCEIMGLKNQSKVSNRVLQKPALEARAMLLHINIASYFHCSVAFLASRGPQTAVISFYRYVRLALVGYIKLFITVYLFILLDIAFPSFNIWLV